MHVSYLFLRTGSIFPPITAHIYCNIMGIPEVAWELKMFPKYRKSMFVLSFHFSFQIVSCSLSIVVSHYRSIFKRYHCFHIYPSEMDPDKREFILALYSVRGPLSLGLKKKKAVFTICSN